MKSLRSNLGIVLALCLVHLIGSEITDKKVLFTKDHDKYPPISSIVVIHCHWTENNYNDHDPALRALVVVERHSIRPTLRTHRTSVIGRIQTSPQSLRHHQLRR